MTTYYLGLSTSGHDPSFALVDDQGNLLFAEAVERHLQDKRAWGASADHFHHIESTLRALNIDIERAHFVVATSWGQTKADMDLAVSHALLPVSDGQLLRRLQARSQEDAGISLLRLGLSGQQDPIVRRFDHHLCHAVTASHSAPFDHGLCLVLDGEGEVGAASMYRLKNGWPQRVWRSWGPGSLGTYYGWLTNQCGFDWRAGEEWKVMGLAAFGTVNPDLAASLAQTMNIEKGRIRLGSEDALAAAKKAVLPFARTAGKPVMIAADLAASGQHAYSILSDQILSACLEDGDENLILTGGCALNSSYNGTLLHRFPLKKIHVPPAPADDGNAIGAALLAWRQDHPDHPLPQGTGTPFLGSTPDRQKIAKVLAHGHPLSVSELGDATASEIAARLASGKILGVMRGAAEFGPRALGHRSILADPRQPDMADRINIQVKGREPYRPFAPVITADRAKDWFEHAQPSPYMSFTLPWKTSVRDRVSAVCHRDGTGRLQTVDATSYPWMNDLVQAFERLTDVPVVLNTSFNIMHKPMVHSVEDAMAVLMTSGLDGVLLDDILIEKTAFTSQENP
ncbi:carbamoyltransferase [Thalassospira lucentensis]|uniref:carbamoyltransferase family protein n=1 Tax=Thalassospira lucentensis TaxID=168935 RepID=UPI003AA8A3DA